MKDDLTMSLKDVETSYRYCCEVVYPLNLLPPEVQDTIWELMKEYMLAKLQDEEIDLSRFEYTEPIDIVLKGVEEDG